MRLVVPGVVPLWVRSKGLRAVRVKMGGLKLKDDFWATRTTFRVLTAGKRSRFYFRNFAPRELREENAYDSLKR
jgi:hypothetical protein